MVDEGKPLRRQLGVQIRMDLWRALRVTALQNGTTATALLEQAIEEYLCKLQKAPPPGSTDGLTPLSKTAHKEKNPLSQSVKMERGKK